MVEYSFMIKMNKAKREDCFARGSTESLAFKSPG
jgi:hypothetical protein